MKIKHYIWILTILFLSSCKERNSISLGIAYTNDSITCTTIMISHESIHKWVYPLIENYNRSLYKEYECKPNSDFIKSLNLILADTSGIELGNVYGRKDSNDHLDLIFVIGESSDPKKPVKIVDNGLAGKFLQIAKLAEEQNLIQKNSNENHIDSGVPPPPPYRGFPSLMKKRK